MPVYEVLGEILQWSLDRPLWQRDCLRRLVTKGELHDVDIDELTILCKSQHGLGPRTQAIPLDQTHLPQPDARTAPVSLESITHHAGVNALAQNQTVTFGPQLTVVYGGNAAGKSGYTRILKRACRARSSESILGNVVSGIAPSRPSATISFLKAEEPLSYLWDDIQSPDACLATVSVFDQQCASVYVTKQTDVAFRPMGLDLFDKLSDISEAVKKALEKERSSLSSQTFHTPDVPEGTTVHELLTNLTSLTDPTAVRELATLTEAQKERTRELQQRLRDLQSDDPRKIAKAIELRAKRVAALAERMSAVILVLSDSSVKDLFAARAHSIHTQSLIDKLYNSSIHSQPLSHIGSPIWKKLWESAREYSTAEAYPSKTFPFVEAGARCVLCQQELVTEGIQRLRTFQDFVASTAQRDHDAAVSAYREKYEEITNLSLLDGQTADTLSEIQLDKPQLSDEIKTCLTAMELRRQKVFDALNDGLPGPQNMPSAPFDVERLAAYRSVLEERAKELRERNKASLIEELQRELNELKAKQILGRHLVDVLDTIERKKKIAAYQLCLDETRTNAITRKSSEVTRRAVTEQLIASFSEELEELKFRHIEVEMVDVGGSRGSLYHRLQLKRAPGIEVSEVVSEGEGRCLSIASFFAELSTAVDRSAIIFDDPVSSLDHEWRGNVAERLVAEAESRQVIVFTHDIVFLLSLTEKANAKDVDVRHQHLRRGRDDTGITSEALPWPAMKVKTRIGHLKALCQDADAVWRRGEYGKYESEAAKIYGWLREAWERAVEEVLLNGVVERYRKGVQTRQIEKLADISVRDCRALEEGMTKTSRWLPGHDESPAVNEPIPDPGELERDIGNLEEWVEGIRSRR